MSTEVPVTFDLLASADSPDFGELYDIYERSIRERERKSREEVASAINSREYRTIVARRSGKIIGFSLVFIAPEHSFGLVEYMAVHPDHRDSGVGAELFRRAIGLARTEQKAMPILLEVDSELEGSPDQVIRRRRQRFYRRLGCRRIDGLSYLLPLAGAGPAPEMDLFLAAANDLPPIRKSRLRRWLEVVYEKVYRCSPGDPRIAHMLESVPDPIRLV